MRVRCTNHHITLPGQVKKKWSLRSISFSRKDKPKQEKKQKDDEPKTNGDAEKLPEEVSPTPPCCDISAVYSFLPIQVTSVALIVPQ